MKTKRVYITNTLNVFDDVLFGIRLGKSTFKHMCYFVSTYRYLDVDMDLDANIVFNAPIPNNPRYVAHTVNIRCTKGG